MKKISLTLIAAVFLVSCSPRSYIEDVVYDMIKENPQKFVAAVQEAAKSARGGGQDQSQELDNSLKNLKNPKVDETRILGNVEAPILIVEYTDIQCPFCARGTRNLEELKGIYGDRIKVLRKHLPLPMHQEAKELALFYEIIASRDLLKADLWIKKAFENQKDTKDKSNYEKWAREVGADVSALKKDLKNETLILKLKERIEMDMEEARSFGIQGTPGYSVNGVLVKGAYPVDYFKKIIERISK